MGEITLTTFLLQEVLRELRSLLGVLVPLAGFGVLVGEIKKVWLFFCAFVMQCCPKSHGELYFFRYFYLILFITFLSKPNTIHKVIQ